MKGLLGLSDSQMKRYINGNNQKGTRGLKDIYPEEFEDGMVFFRPAAVSALKIYSQYARKRKLKTLEELAMKRGFPQC